MQHQRFVRVLAVALMLCLAVFLTLGNAWAGPNCGPYQMVEQRLRDGYGESAVGRGLGANGALVLLFVAEATRTWTVVVAAPDGTTCMVASGEDWDAMGKRAPGEDG